MKLILGMGNTFPVRSLCPCSYFYCMTDDSSLSSVGQDSGSTKNSSNVSDGICDDPPIVEDSEYALLLRNPLFNPSRSRYELMLYIQMQLCSEETLEDFLVSQLSVSECSLPFYEVHNT